VRMLSCDGVRRNGRTPAARRPDIAMRYNRRTKASNAIHQQAPDLRTLRRPSAPPVPQEEQ
jgi:hypothetical protein